MVVRALGIRNNLGAKPHNELSSSTGKVRGVAGGNREVQACLKSGPFS